VPEIAEEKSRVKSVGMTNLQLAFNREITGNATVDQFSHIAKVLVSSIKSGVCKTGNDLSYIPTGNVAVLGARAKISSPPLYPQPTAYS